ncbi:hypothetical protein QLH51_17560 [Sphingomonas sp. 2R-10]|uniref:hypothetical protein n=1 Tax=Sphingomonas sp. 2R-10 TaxID=3045148 RepID=UPI0013DD9F39|nr:hypothetical protein [Sphingomonas sp. 2R-10]MDJ0278602.1 hypothetical protein [Sphingomonas sp. 2R-10]
MDARLIVPDGKEGGGGSLIRRPFSFWIQVMDDDTIIDTPEGPKRWGDWKKKNPVQLPSRRTKGKDLPNKVKMRTDE